MWRRFAFISLCVITVLLVFATRGSSLNCYQCNSYINKSCEAIDQKEDKIYLQPCPENYTLCRTAYNTIRKEYRVIRSCGKAKHKYPCYSGTSTTQDIKLHTCECNKDGCNAAVKAESSVVKLISVVLLSIYLLR